MTIEVATALPLNNVVEESEWTLVDQPGEFLPQFAYGSDNIVRYNVARWHAKLTFRGLSQADRHLMARFVAAVGTHRPFWVWEPSHNLRGSIASAELLTAPDTGTFWTGGTGRSITDDSGGARVTRTSTDGSTVGTTNSFAVTANAKYAFRMVVEPGAGASHSVTLTAGTTRTGSTYGLSPAFTTGGRVTLLCQPSASPMFVGWQDAVPLNANWTQQGFYLIRNTSVVRCFEIDGGTGSLTQVGSRAYVDNLPVGTAGLLKAGDMVEVYNVAANFSQLVRLTEDISADASGKSYMCFEPKLHLVANDGDLVIPVKPMACMRLKADPGIITRPGWYSDVVLECKEAFQ